jgi:hypothetical protein
MPGTSTFPLRPQFRRLTFAERARTHEKGAAHVTDARGRAGSFLHQRATGHLQRHFVGFTASPPRAAVAA